MMTMVHNLAMRMDVQLLLFAGLVLSSASQTEHRELYVKSSPDQHCPQGYLCRTLLDYLHNISATFTTNTTLHFLPGNHSAVWSHNMTLVISNVSYLVLTGPDVAIGPGKPPQASIWCKYTMQFHFRHTTDLAIRHILFTECGTSHITPEKGLFPDFFFSSSPPATLQFNAARNVVIESVHITGSDGYGLLTLNMMGSCSITNCMLNYNGWKSFPQDGGNAYLDYQQNNNIMFPNATESALTISDTVINGRADTNMLSSRGMKITVHYIIVQYQLNITVINCSFLNSNGSNMRLALFGPMPLLSLTLHIMNTTFKNGQAQSNGGGLSLMSTSPREKAWCVLVLEYSQLKIVISNSFFIGNEGGGLYSNITASLYSLNILKSYFIASTPYGAQIKASKGENDNITILLQNSTFIKNELNYGHGGILHFNAVSRHFAIVMIGCHFTDNKVQSLKQGISGVILLLVRKVPHVFLSIYDTHWYNNSGNQLLIKIKKQAHILVADCTFQYGHNYGSAIYISVHDVDDILNVKHNISITRTVFQYNSPYKGTCVHIENAQFTQTHIIGCVFHKNVAWELTMGCVIKIEILPHWSKPSLITTESLPSFVVINHTSISENYADCAGIYIDIHSIDMLISLTAVEIHATQFIHNKGSSVVIHNERFSSNSGSEITVLISNSYFHGNLATIKEYSAAVINVTETIEIKILDLDHIDIQTKLVVTETDFTENIGSCIALDGSQLSLTKQIYFTDNTAYAGAAILLDCSDTSKPSYLNIHNNATVIITNNTAEQYGGGIAVNPACYHMSQCFYYATCWNQTWPCIVYMEGNSALTAGNSIYGPPVDFCETQLSDLFNIIDGYTANEVVLFEQYSICFCIEDPITKFIRYELELSREVRLGQEITLQANICTRPFTDNNTYAIQAEILNNHTGELGKRQSFQRVTKSCDNLTYSLVTDEEYVIVNLFHDTITSTQQTLLNLSILPCSIGFKLDHGLKCNCIDYLLLYLPSITCNAATSLIHAPAGIWIGQYTNGKLVAHQNCPFDYCNAQSHYIDLLQQDLQCTNNRSGVLCGACKAGLSLTLGSARCVNYCSNFYLFLVIPLALAGVLLVFLMLKCNLTVTTGTNNALIFYANIIHVNRTVFYPQKSTNIIIKFLAVVIAWLNLDLGIDSCFYKGATAYGNAWLQFAFPIYLWMLVFVIIYTSKYSITASKLFGRNAVHVLATLFLLSYAKLLRTIIAAISPITVHDESGNTHLVWLMDGNVPFLGVKHAALFSMALLTVLLYILPLTLLTLLAPLLQARTHHPLLRWVVRIKPLLDAYQGPYKDKYRYWTGIMLTMRLVLFTVFAANTLGDSNINLFSIILAVILYSLFTTSVSKNRLNLILESFYSLNLSVYASETLLLKAMHKDSEHLTWVMAGSALAVFCFTITWHLHTFVSIIRDTFGKLKLFLKSHLRRRADDGSGQECGGIVAPSPARQPAPTTSVIDMMELREPLLTDN